QRCPAVPNPQPNTPSQAAESSGAGAPGGRLPSGAWIAVGLAVAVLAAWALALLRRRHPRHGPPPDRASTPPPEPGLIAAARRMLGRQAAQGLPRDPRYGAPVPPINASTSEQADLINWAAGGLGLTGPGAVAAARAAVAGILCAGGPLAPERRGIIVTTAMAMTSRTTETEHRQPPQSLRLVVLPDPDQAVQWLQVETIRRRRLCEEHDADTIAQLAQLDPYGEPLPPVLAVLPAPPPGHIHTLKTLLDQAAPLGIAALLLGDWPGNTVFVDGDGHTSNPSDQHAPEGCSTRPTHRRNPTINPRRWTGPNPPTRTRSRTSGKGYAVRDRRATSMSKLTSNQTASQLQPTPTTRLTPGHANRSHRRG
ncbi:MAG: hypothetical protein ACRDQW_00850, partial [Haloechinothrix sp.]